MEVNIDDFDTFQRCKYLVLSSIFTVLIAFSGRLKFLLFNITTKLKTQSLIYFSIPGKAFCIRVTLYFFSSGIIHNIYPLHALKNGESLTLMIVARKLEEKGKLS